KGKVAIVTGVSRGIGWSTARVLLDEGASAVGVSRTAPNHHLQGLHHVQADLLDAGAAEHVLHVARSELGRVDVLVNNAGSAWLRDGYDATRDEAWKTAWELLFLSVVRMSNAALPALVEAGGGAIINVSSRNAQGASSRRRRLRGRQGSTEQLLERTRRPIRGGRNPSGDGVPRTDRHAALVGPGGGAAQQAAREGTDARSIIQAVEARMPHGRFVKAAEVADLIVFLASARAESISGIDVLIDAGATQTL
ncbi:MAG TPA: SDR family oxidoreductase, partial [Solirubrobacteraceae bacterium]|nr:SDR family oxidoreductase [Solirubrobacteraceae bacterium]